MKIHLLRKYFNLKIIIGGINVAIEKETIDQTAKLSKLEFTEEEKNDFYGQLERIIDMVEQLDELDVKGVEGTYHGIDLHSVLREDKAVNDVDREELLNNTKTHKDGFIQVPAMMSDNEEGEA